MREVVLRTELITPGPASALSRVLGVSRPDHDAALPFLWHWVYLLERPSPADLGLDGHPMRNTVPTAPIAGGRRMWAGGTVHQRRPLRVGEEASRRTQVVGQERKTGRSGGLIFLTVQHEYSQASEVLIVERQNIAYRKTSVLTTDDERKSVRQRPTQDGNHQAENVATLSLAITPPLLFQFSALTYNAHRIHYDRDYARQTEGFPGLVVHGPLQALAMAEAARTLAGSDCQPAASFAYRLVDPLFEGDGLHARAESVKGAMTTVIQADSGRVTARGTLQYGTG